MKKIIVLLFISLPFCNVFAQEITRNNVYLELGGSAYIYSINYERLLLNKSKVNVPVRVGFMGFPRNIPASTYGYYGFPLSISFIQQMKNENLFFESRLMLCIFFSETWSHNGNGAPVQSYNYYWDKDYLLGYSFGLRRQPKEKGLYHHVHFQLFLYDQYVEDLDLIPWFSLGIGYAF